MAQAVGSLTVKVPRNSSYVVTMTLTSGGTATIYSDAACTTTVSMPDTITAAKTYYVLQPAEYQLSVTSGGFEVASPAGVVQKYRLMESDAVTVAPRDRDLDLGGTSGVSSARQVLAGSGLSGGGDLSVDRTLSITNLGAASGVATTDSGNRVAQAPKLHASAHLPNAADAIDWSGSVHMYGTEASLPAASSSNAGLTYEAYDVGVRYRSNGTTWDIIRFDPTVLLDKAGSYFYSLNVGRSLGGGSQNNSAQVASGTLWVGAIVLPKGKPITTLGAMTGATALTVGTSPHLWMGVWDYSTFVCKAITADNTAPTWAANTATEVATTATYTPTATAVHLIGVMLAQTGGTMPTLRATAANLNAISAGTGIGSGLTVLCAQANVTGLTTPPTVGSASLGGGTFSSLTTVASAPFMWAR